jgi:hypothetical protein
MLGSFTLLRGAKLPNNILYGHRQAGQLFLKIWMFLCDCVAQKHLFGWPPTRPRSDFAICLVAGRATRFFENSLGRAFIFPP